MGHGGPWSISGGGSEGGEVPPEDAGARVEPGEATRGGVPVDWVGLPPAD